MNTLPHSEIIQCLCDRLCTNYIFPEVAEQISANLQARLEAGEYHGLEEGEFFALALTLHMQEINHDEHLWVRWHAEPLPEDEGQLLLNEAWQAERKLEAKLDNYGFHKVERLAGNVGYLDVRYFHRPEWGGETAHAAMALLANTQALIIDLRQCTGGFPGMVALVLSYLFGEEPEHLSSIYWRDEQRTEQFWTLPNLPGLRDDAKPVYVLISKVTFSGGEMFASILKNRRRGTLLGVQTDGGANAGASYRLHPNFEAFIPIGRSIDPLNGENWEGVGVSPDISIPPEKAFDAAYRLALQTILAGLGESPSGPLKALADEAQAALECLE
jgi:hypothetical protein